MCIQLFVSFLARRLTCNFRDDSCPIRLREKAFRRQTDGKLLSTSTLVPVLVLLLGVAMQSATIIDVAPYINRRASATTRNEMFTLAVRISDMIYSADFRVSRKLKPDDFTIGEQVQATVENGKMTCSSPRWKDCDGEDYPARGGS